LPVVDLARQHNLEILSNNTLGPSLEEFLIFGIMFPVFMFLAFAVERDVPRQSLRRG